MCPRHRQLYSANAEGVLGSPNFSKYIGIVSNITNNRLDNALHSPLNIPHFQNYIESVLGDGYCLNHNTFITMDAITTDKIEQVSKTETIIQTIRAVYDSE